MNASEPSPHWRRIRSFVRRPGRMTTAQEKALSDLLPHYAWSPGQTHPKAQGLIMEIGFGNGGALIEMAQNEPDTHFIGVEVHPPGVGRLLNALDAHQITNVSVAMRDAVDLLSTDLVDGALDEVRIYFPDPWPKKKHHKRRLIQSDFVQLLAQKIKPGGRLHLATDWAPYAEWMIEVMLGSSAFDRCFEMPVSRPQTHFERRGLKRGYSIMDLLYERVDQGESD